MYLHLATDEKFIDAAHAAFERAEPGKHRFVVADAQGDLRFIRSFEPERATLPTLLDPAFLKGLATYDAVFLHSLNSINRLIVDRAPAGVRFVWLGWGFDYYPMILSDKEQLLPLTRTLPSARQRLPWHRVSPAAIARYLRSDWPSLVSRWRARRRARAIDSGGPEEAAMIGKITYFAPVLPTEDALVRTRNPSFKPRFASWNYGVHDVLATLTAPSGIEKSHRCIVGNSASRTSNHVDAFAWLEGAGFTGDVICPLSYGDPAYRDIVMREGHARLGERFKPIVEFMAAAEYARCIAGSTHLLMNHLRQQGLTNILVALHAGTRVLMREESPLFSFLGSLGLHVGRVGQAADLTPLSEEVVDGDRAIIDAYFGADNHHRRTVALLNSVGR